MPFNESYNVTLEQLRLLAQQDLAQWWAGTGQIPGPRRMDALRDVFYVIQAKYGTQAANLAAEQLFMDRQLDTALRGLEFPKVADPASYDQARAAFNWATTNYRENFDADHLAPTQKKLAGVMGRLVTQPAHTTVADAVISAGTGYARIPEPGACKFCLMLASRGAAYSREAVSLSNRYHDGCRCVGVEVRDDSQLPRINRELAKLWTVSKSRTQDDFAEAIKQYQAT